MLYNNLIHLIILGMGKNKYFYKVLSNREFFWILIEIRLPIRLSRTQIPGDIRIFFRIRGSYHTMGMARLFLPIMAARVLPSKWSAKRSLRRISPGKW